MERGLSGENGGLVVLQTFGLGLDVAIEVSPLAIDVAAIVLDWLSIEGPIRLQRNDSLAGLTEICDKVRFVFDLLALNFVGVLALNVLFGIGAQCGPGSLIVGLPFGIIGIEQWTQCLLQAFLLREQCLCQLT